MGVLLEPARRDRDGSRAHGRPSTTHGARGTASSTRRPIEAARSTTSRRISIGSSAPRTTRSPAPGAGRDGATSSCGPRRRAGGARAPSANGPPRGGEPRVTRCGRRAGFFVDDLRGLGYSRTWYIGVGMMTTTYRQATRSMPSPRRQLFANVLMRWRRSRRPRQRIFIDEAGKWARAPHERRVLTADGTLKHPKFDHILSGCTSLRLLELGDPARARHAQGSRGVRCPRGEAVRRARCC